MPFSVHGIGVSRGCAIGQVYLFQRDQLQIAEYSIPDTIIEGDGAALPAQLGTGAATVASNSRRHPRHHPRRMMHNEYMEREIPACAGMTGYSEAP